MSDSLDLSIIIVNFNGASFLKDCLDSIYEQTTEVLFETIVVDNASQDDSVKVLKKYPQPLRLIFNSENLGFAKANNKALFQANGHYILFLNNDTVVRDRAIEKMIQFMKKTPNAGAVGPKLLNRDLSLQGSGSLFSKWIYKTNRTARVSFISGAAILAPKELLQDLKGFDENFFFYNEDLDLCKRILKRGRPIYYFPDSEMVHFGGMSTQSRSKESIIEGYRGSLYFCRKHYGEILFQIYRWAVLIDIVPRLFLSKKESIRQTYQLLFWRVVTQKW